MKISTALLVLAAGASLAGTAGAADIVGNPKISSIDFSMLW